MHTGRQLPLPPVAPKTALPAARQQARRPGIVAANSAASEYSAAEKRWNEQVFLSPLVMLHTSEWPHAFISGINRHGRYGL